MTDFIFFLPIILQIFFGTYVYQKNPKALENRLFSLWMFVLFISNSAALFQRLARNAETASLANPFYISFGTFLDALCMVMVVSSVYYPEFLSKKKFTVPLIGITLLLAAIPFTCYFEKIGLLCNDVKYEDLAFVPVVSGPYIFIIPIFMSTAITLCLVLLVLGYIKGKKRERYQIPWIFLSLFGTSILAFLAGKFHVISRSALTFLPLIPVLFFAYFILKHKLFSPIQIGMEHALESMKEGFIVLDSDWKILQINPSARKMFGKNLDEVLKDIKGIEERQKEITFAKPEERIVAINISEIKNDEGIRIGTLILSRDVTEKRKAEREVRETKDFLENVIETSVDGIFVVDKTSVIIRANKAALGITGYNRDEVLGKPMRIFTMNGEEYRKKAQEMLERLRSQDKINSYENLIKTKKGEPIPVEWSIAKLKDLKGKVIGATIIMRDLRERKELQAQLIQTGKLAAVGELSAGVAHELNNPLAGVLGYSQLILERMEKFKKDGIKADDLEKITTYQKYIEKESHRCKTIVLNLLKFSRASKFDFQQVNINSVLEDTFVFTEHQLSMNKVELLRDLAGHELIVKGNPHQLQQVFTNIILNAQKAMSNEGGKLFVRSRINNGFGDNGKCVEVEFSDTGCGIPEENIHRIFEPFFTTRPPGEGTGLGLSVSYGIIKEHNGEIKVRSKVGEGTTFTISLPSMNS